MPYIVEKYACHNCHKVFDNYEEAKSHEEKCNKCNNCKHAYYVYGCEFDCKHLKDCKYPSYKYFEKK